MLRQLKSPLLNAYVPEHGSAFLPDARVKAIVVAGPGLGFTTGPHGLDNVRVPVQLWSGDRDLNVPYASNAQPIREALGSRLDFHSVPGAAHYAFLVPCGLIGPPTLCADQAPFDRRAFHAQMNGNVISFFQAKLNHQ